MASVFVGNKIEFGENSEMPSCENNSQLIERGSYAPEKEFQGLNPDNIALLNWNIYKGNEDNWKQDLSIFARTHDIMTIQEALLDEQLTQFLSQKKLNWVMNNAFYLNGAAAGVMTTSNTKAIHSCGFRTNEPVIQIPKSTLLSYYVINGMKKRLLVANIHSINFSLGIKTYQQQLEKLYDVIKHHDGPMIVAGDFNSWSDERMMVVQRLVEKLSLSSLDYPVKTKTHVFGKAIDHVFYRSLEAINNQVIQVSSSDHMPISVNFKVKSILLH